MRVYPTAPLEKDNGRESNLYLTTVKDWILRCRKHQEGRASVLGLYDLYSF
jgi:hypothetical protein